MEEVRATIVWPRYNTKHTWKSSRLLSSNGQKKGSVAKTNRKFARVVPAMEGGVKRIVTDRTVRADRMRQCS